MGSGHVDVLGTLLGGAGDSGVRRAHPRDAATAAAVQVRAWQAAPGLVSPPDVADVTDQWRTALDLPTTLAWVAVTGEGTVVGAAVADLHEGEGELLALDVDPAARRRGHGSRLLAAVAEHLADAGASTLTTWILLDDEARARFFRSAGFAPDGARTTLADEGGRQVRLTRLATRLAGPASESTDDGAASSPAAPRP
ncbi:MAG: GNAT family N-acetyltransferase [Kineosporiaceae bacterium]